MKLLLAAALAVLSASPPPPFPAPKLIEVTELTKCDWGPIASIKPDATELVLSTPAGPVTFQLGPAVQVFGNDGRPLGPASVLHAGQNVRIYYVIDNGAKAREIDVI